MAIKKFAIGSEAAPQKITANSKETLKKFPTSDSKTKIEPQYRPQRNLVGSGRMEALREDTYVFDAVSDKIRDQKEIDLQLSDPQYRGAVDKGKKEAFGSLSHLEEVHERAATARASRSPSEVLQSAQRPRTPLARLAGEVETKRRETTVGSMKTPVELKGNRVEVSRGLDKSPYGVDYRKNWPNYTPLASYMTDDEADYYSYLYTTANEATADFWLDGIAVALEKRAASNTPKTEWVSHNPMAETASGYLKYLTRGLKGLDREAFAKTDHELPAHLTDDEWNWYAYTRGKFGQDEADAYYKTLRGALNERKYDKIALGAERLKREPTDISDKLFNKGLEIYSARFNAKNAPANEVAGGVLGFAGDVVEYLFKGEVDPYSANNSLQNLAAAQKRHVEGKIKNPILKTAYQLGSSAFETALTYYLSAGIGELAGSIFKVAGTAGKIATTANTVAKVTNTVTKAANSALMGSRVFSHTVQDAIQRGADSGEAVGLGLIAAAIEGITENYSISKFLDDPTNLVHVGLSNMEEEMAANVLNTVADVVVLQDKSAWQQAINAYMVNQKMSEEEAFANALWDKAKEVGIDGIGGLFTGLVLSAPSSISYHADVASYNAQLAAAKTEAASRFGKRVADALVINGVDEQAAGRLGEALAQSTVHNKRLSRSDAALLAQYPVAQRLYYEMNNDADADGEQYSNEGERHAEEGDRYSIAKTSKMDYFTQLKMIERGELNGSNYLYIGTPDTALQSAGVSANPFSMSQKDYRKSRRAEGNNARYSSHSVPYTFFEYLPNKMAEAPLLVDNGKKMTVITTEAMQDTKGNASYIVVGVERDVPIDFTQHTNQVKSVYPWDDFAQRIRRAAESGSLVVTNKNKAEQILRTIGIQPAEVSRILNLAKTTISQPAPAVNPQASVLQSTATNEGGNNNGTNVFDGNEGRPAGVGAGGQTGSVRSGTEPSGREGRRIDQLLDRVARSGAHFQSTKSLGISRGTDRMTAREVPSSLWDAEMQEADRRVYSVTGKHLRFVVGMMEINGTRGVRPIKGVRTDTNIIVKADHPYLTPTKIALHEMFHELVAQYPQLRERAWQSIRNKFTDQQIGEIADLYRTNLQDVYSTDEAIMDEVLADAYAGINMFGANTTMFSDAVQNATDTTLGEGRTAPANAAPRAPPQSDGEHMMVDDASEQKPYSPYGLYVPGTPGVADTKVGNKRITADAGDERTLTDDAPYSYEALVQKPPVEVVVFKERPIPTKGKKLDTPAIADEGLRGASVIEIGSKMQRYVYIKDIGENVSLPKRGLVHGITGNKTKGSALNTAQITYYLPDVLRNSIAINELAPRTKDDGEYSVVLIGYCESEEGNGYIVRSTVNHFSQNRSIVDDLQIYNVLKGAKSKKTEAQVMRSYTGSPAAYAANTWTSTISVAELLNIVKENYPEFLSKSVRDHYGLDVEPYDGARYSAEDTILGIIDEITDEPSKGAEEGGDEPTQKKKAKPHSRLQKKIAAVNRLAKSRVSMSEEGVLYVGNESGMVRLADGMFQQEDFDNVGKVSSELSAVFDAYRGIVERETKRGMSSPESAHLLEVELPTMDEVEQAIRDGAEENKQRMKRGEKMLPVLFVIDPALPPVYAAKLRDALRILGENLQGRVTVKRKVGADRELLPWKYQQVYVKGNGGDALLAFAEENVVKAHGDTYASLFEPNGVQDALMGKIEQMQTVQEENGQRNEQENLVGRKQSKSKALREIDDITDTHHDADQEYWRDAVERAKAYAAHEEESATRLMNEGYTTTPEMDELGIKFANPVTTYDDADYLLAEHAAYQELEDATHDAEARWKATDDEQKHARLLADGVITLPPHTVRRWVMEDLAQYYSALNSIGMSRLDKHKQSVKRQLYHEIDDVLDGLAQTGKKAPKKQIAFGLGGGLMYMDTHRALQQAMHEDEFAEKMHKVTFGGIHDNNGYATDFKNRMFAAVRFFTDSKGKQRKLTDDESVATHVVLEGRAVEKRVKKSINCPNIEAAAHNLRNGQKPSAVRDEFHLSDADMKLARKYKWWLEQKAILDASRIDMKVVNDAVAKYTEMYDKLFVVINQVLVAHGYEPIRYVKGYAPHLQEPETRSRVRTVLAALGIEDSVYRLPTEIAGQTEFFRPGKKWNPHLLSRHGDTTVYDIRKGYQEYVSLMAEMIFHIDDIARIRATSAWFREKFSNKKTHEKIELLEEKRWGTTAEKEKFLRENRRIPTSKTVNAEEVETLLNEFDEELREQAARDTKYYSDLVSWLDEFANMMAGKQLTKDRADESFDSRESLNRSAWIRSWIALSKIALNLSSALNQLSQITPLMAHAGLGNTAKAAWWNLASHIKLENGKIRISDEFAQFVAKSPYLTNKVGVKELVPGTLGKNIKTATFKLTEITDLMMSSMAVRAYYEQNLAKGMSETEAMRKADHEALMLMGSRMKGERAAAMEVKSLFTALLNMFQNEVLVMWNKMRHDMPRQVRAIAQEKGAARAAWIVAGDIAKYLLLAFIHNRIAEPIYGATPAPFDVGGWILNFVAKGMGMSTVQLFRKMITDAWEWLNGREPSEDEKREFHAGRAFLDTVGEIADDVPFVNNAAALLHQGDEKIPVPDVLGKVKEGIEIWDEKPEDGEKDKRGENIALTAGDLIAQLIPWGTQIKKTAQGATAMIRGGAYTGFGDDKRLQYPVDGTWDEWIRGVMFGKNALPETDDFYASGEKWLSVKQTQVYEEVVDSGADRKTVYNTILSIRNAEDARSKRDVLEKADLTDEQKLMLYSVISESGKEKLQGMMDTGMSWSDVMAVCNKVDALSPEKGKKSVSSRQKQQAIVKMSLSEKEKMAALSVYMPDSTYRKLEIVSGYDVTPTQWVTYFSAADKDESGNISQMEANMYLKTMTSLNSQQRAALWQATNAGWNPKSNPFSKSVSFKVQEKLKEE